MPHPFGTPIPSHPVHQKHAKPKVSDNTDFFDDLEGDQAFDENLQWFWRNPKKRTKKSGGTAFGLHWHDPHRNGYDRITTRISGHLVTRRMKPAELHREEWASKDVYRWRRGRTRFGPRPKTFGEICRYCHKHGGQPVWELKDPDFGIAWIMQHLVATCARFNIAAWFKALGTMSHSEEKCAATRAAEARGHTGQFALIWGDAVKGRAARIAHSKKKTATWAVKPNALW